MKSFLTYSDNINLDTFIHDIGDAICICDGEMNILAVNKNFSSFYGKNPEDLLNKSPFLCYQDFNNSVFYNGIKKTIETGETTIRLGYSNNLKGWLVVRSFKCKQYNTYAIIIHKLENEMERGFYLNQHDNLTSLKNRFAFETDLNNIHKYKSPYGLVIFDINNFKKFNETMGYHNGDFCLVEIATRIKEIESQTNQVYRINADQFAIIIRGGDRTSNIERIKVIQNKCKEDLLIDKAKYSLNISVGFIFVSGFDESYSEILSKAEIALKKAKKNLFLFEEYNKLNKSYKTFSLSQELRQAIEKRTLKIQYQPQIDMIQDKVYGIEELIRWNHDDRGNISPIDFLTVAEEYNLMFEIDKYVITETLNDMVYFRNNGILLPVSINLSAKSLCSESMPSILETLVNKFNIPKNLITIEITENSLMENIEISKKNIASIKECGFQISLDDFGTGYSSMGYLMRYPANILKIDREFIKNIDIDKSSQNITSNIINLGHSLNMFVVAEGVETKEEKETLKMLSCNAVQGFYYAKSMVKEDLISYVSKVGISLAKSKLF